MRIVTAALVALAVSPAAADTAVSTSGACEVRFVRAPDDVRHVIERWLAAEPVCVSSIDLRVVPTDDGYYLLAQRGDGRIHERVVPDADSAGVLVASWVADDWVEAPPQPRPVAPRPLIVNPFADEPERDIAARVAAPGRKSGRWLSLGGMIRAGGAGGGGVRAELGLLRTGAWTVGAAFSVSEADNPTFSADGSAALYTTQDLKAMAFVGRTSTFGRWELQLAVGGGLLHTESGLTGLTYYSYPGFMSGSIEGVSRLDPAAEASAVLSRRISESWSISAGPVLTVMKQESVLTLDPGGWDPVMTIAGRDWELMFVGGLRYSL